MTGASWDGHLLRLKGFALIRNAPTRGTETELHEELVAITDSGGAGSVKPLEVVPVYEPRATTCGARPSQNYDDCGFECTVDVAAVLSSAAEVSTWHFQLEGRVQQVRRRGGVTGIDRPRVDRSWHEVAVPGRQPIEVRLLEGGDQLALQLRDA